MRVNSSNVHSIDYDPVKRVLTVVFRNGGTYDYHDFQPDHWEAIKNAESIGKHLHQHVKDKFHHVRK